MTQLRRKTVSCKHLPPMDFMRDRDSFDHAQEIIKPFGVIEHVLNWCKSELPGPSRFSGGRR